MAKINLKNLFGSDKLELPIEIPAGFQPGGDPLTGSIDGSADLPAFGRLVNVSGSLSASALRLRPSDKLSFFPTEGAPGQPLAPPSGSAFTELNVGGQAALSGSTSASNGPFQLTLTGKAQADFAFRSVQPVKSGTKTVKALEALVAATRMPAQVRLEDLEPGAYYQYAFNASADLGLKIEAGWDQAISRSLFDDLSSDLSFEYQATLEASFGVSLYDKFQLSVGKIATLNNGFVRARLDRRHQNKLSLGAVFALQMKYDLGGLAAIVDALVAETGIRPLLDGANEYAAKLKPIVQALDSGNTAALEAALTGKATASLKALLGVDDFISEITSSDQAKQLAKTLNGIVTSYDELGGRLQSLWDRVLGQADLGPGSPVRRALEDLAKLENATPQTIVDGLLKGDAKEAVDLLEVLSGQDLESLIISDDMTAQINEVGKKATAALSFLDTLAVQGAMARIDEFTQSTGIAKALDFIRANGSSTASMQQALSNLTDKNLEKVISKIVGKAIDAIDESDIHALKRLEGALSDFGTIDQRLKARFEKLKGDLGFSVGIEFERLTYHSSLLDIEMDPSDHDCQHAWARLRVGDVRGFLRELPQVDDTKDKDEWPYLIREGLLVSRHIRSSAFKLFFSLIGTETDIRKRVTEARITLDNSGRKAAYSGGFSASFERKSWSWSGGAWLVAKARSSKLNPNAPYDKSSLDLSLRLSASREDQSTSKAELEATANLLSDLGFAEAQEVANLAMPAKAPTRLAMSLELGRSALKAVVAGLDNKSHSAVAQSIEWDDAFLNAGHRWFDSALVDTTLKDAAVPAGPIFAAVVVDPAYEEQWRLGTHINLTADGHALNSTRYPVLKDLGRARGLGVKRLKTAHGVFLSATKSGSPKDLLNLSKKFATAAGLLTPHFWANPTFLTWLVLARLTADDPAELAGIKGVASFRWKNAAEEWQEPSIFTLDHGVPKHPLGGDVFPLEEQ